MLENKFTIAQALRRVKILKGVIAENTTRAINSVSYAEQNPAPFKFEDCVQKIKEARNELVLLETGIAIANANTKIQLLDKCVSLAFAIRTLQEIKSEMTFLKSLIIRNEVVKSRQIDWDDALDKNVVSTIETKYVSCLSEQERDEQLNKLQKEFELVNNAVEQANHTTFIAVH